MPITTPASSVCRVRSFVRSQESINFVATLAGIEAEDQDKTAISDADCNIGTEIRTARQLNLFVPRRDLLKLCIMTDLAKQVLETLVHQLRAYAKAYIEFDGACSDAANMINRLMVTRCQDSFQLYLTPTNSGQRHSISRHAKSDAERIYGMGDCSTKKALDNARQHAVDETGRIGAKVFQHRQHQRCEAGARHRFRKYQNAMPRLDATVANKRLDSVNFVEFYFVNCLKNVFIDFVDFCCKISFFVKFATLRCLFVTLKNNNNSAQLKIAHRIDNVGNNTMNNVVVQQIQQIVSIEEEEDKHLRDLFKDSLAWGLFVSICFVPFVVCRRKGISQIFGINDVFMLFRRACRGTF